MVCLITAHVSAAPAAVCVDMRRRLDAPVIKFPSQVTLSSSRQAVSKVDNGSRSQSDGSEAGDCLLCRHSSKAAFQSCLSWESCHPHRQSFTWTWNQHLFC